MTIFLETKRLIIKIPSENDIDDQFKLQSDPDVMRYIAAGARTRSEVDESLQKCISHYNKHGFSLGSVFEKESGEFIGRAGLIYLAFDDTQPDIEVGYALLKSHWKKGYATELTKALIEWGFSHLSVIKLVASTRPENQGSRKVLEKSGMHFVKIFQYNGIDSTYYEIERQFQFRKLQVSDIPVIHHWFNLPHVQEFYSLRNWTQEEVLKKLNPYISGEKNVFPYIVSTYQKPIAYVQYCCIAEFPWPDQDLSEDVVRHAAGMDIFIGESEFMGKGFGTQIIKQFLQEIIRPLFKCCIVDPDIKNEAAIRCYKKLGFKDHKIIQTQNALGQNVELQLMVLSL